MLINDVMNTRVYTVKRDTPVSRVASLIVQFRISGLPVVDDTGKLVGVVSEKDVMKAMYPSYDEFTYDSRASRSFEEMEERYSDLWHIQTSEIMTRNVISTTPETPVLQAGSLMIRKRVRRLPVVERNSSTLVGVVTLGDIHIALLSKKIMADLERQTTDL